MDLTEALRNATALEICAALGDRNIVIINGAALVDEGERLEVHTRELIISRPILRLESPDVDGMQLNEVRVGRHLRIVTTPDNLAPLVP